MRYHVAEFFDFQYLGTDSSEPQQAPGRDCGAGSCPWKMLGLFQLSHHIVGGNGVPRESTWKEDILLGPFQGPWKISNAITNNQNILNSNLTLFRKEGWVAPTPKIPVAYTRNRVCRDTQGLCFQETGKNQLPRMLRGHRRSRIG